MPLIKPDDLAALKALSAEIGADPLLIQAAGGNTSVKDDTVMWIKASGTLLADALTQEIFVPVDLPAMRAAVAQHLPRADQPAEFALTTGLRPSIETSLHAVFSQRVVVHVHCVNTLALAIRSDARAAFTSRLAGFHWAMVPYCKPGARLAGEVAAALRPETNVVILANHGLIVAADSVPAAAQLLAQVVAALQAPVADFTADMAGLVARADATYQPCPADHPLHGVATSSARLNMALSGSLYPDHVIFCGVGAVALKPDETPSHAGNRQPAPVFLLVPGLGALIRSDASKGAQALARCLGDVLARVPEDATVQCLTDAENADLLNWDAEKYRQALNVT